MYILTGAIMTRTITIVKITRFILKTTTTANTTTTIRAIKGHTIQNTWEQKVEKLYWMRILSRMLKSAYKFIVSKWIVYPFLNQYHTFSTLVNEQCTPSIPTVIIVNNDDSSSFFTNKLPQCHWTIVFTVKLTINWGTDTSDTHGQGPAKKMKCDLSRKRGQGQGQGNPWRAEANRK